jgi:hypothetical protein
MVGCATQPEVRFNDLPSGSVVRGAALFGES